ncbi:MAG: histidine phosphatase family protein [Patescibacteria group bacterium]
MKKGICTLYIIRHGETEWNRDKIVMGQKDAPLTGSGVCQAQELGALLAPIDFSAAYTSDSPRAFITAKIVSGARLIPLRKSSQLRERHFARFEGMPSAEYREKNRASLLAKDALSEEKRWDFKIAGCVESDASLVKRVLSMLRRIALIHKGEKVLVSTHGGPIRFLLMKLGFAPYGSLPGGSFKNCGYIVVGSDGTEFNIIEVHGVSTHESTDKKSRG